MYCTIIMVDIPSNNEDSIPDIRDYFLGLKGLTPLKPN